MASVRDSKRWGKRKLSSFSTNSFFRRRWTKRDGVFRGIGKNIQEMPDILAICASCMHSIHYMHLDTQMASLNHAALYERLFLLNRCLEQAGEILDLYELDGVLHPVYANARKNALEDLRADLSHVLTGRLHQRELEACLASGRIQDENNRDA